MSVKSPHDEIMTDTINDGRHDFDFLFGDWRIRNRKLTDMTDSRCDEWVEFDATGHALPILGGLGNVDTFSVPALPNGKSFEGATVRLFDTESRQWKIWWASDGAPGHLDPPVAGQFVDKHGVFYGEDAVEGKPVKVRFDWTAFDAHHARWDQAFSFDGGETWIHNWRMDFTRVDA
jgi:hypothetical protein